MFDIRDPMIYVIIFNITELKMRRENSVALAKLSIVDLGYPSPALRATSPSRGEVE